MCGRFTLKTPASAWVQELFPGLRLLDLPELPPRYNIAPTQPILCVLPTSTINTLQVQSFRWGLIPFWADDLAIGNRMINARSETLAEKPSFRKPLADQRCVVVADGYYEWMKAENGTKRPFWIHRPLEKPFLMAGLWECNRKLNAQTPVYSTTIITTASNQTTRAVHDRMPVLLTSLEQTLRWLDPHIHSASMLESILQPAPDDWLELREVSTLVNRPSVDSIECLSSA